MPDDGYVSGSNAAVCVKNWSNVVFHTSTYSPDQPLDGQSSVTAASPVGVSVGSE